MERPESKANISRRLFIAGTGAAVAGVAVAACGDDDKTEGTTAATTGGSADGAGTTATTAAKGGAKKGGTLKVGIMANADDILDGQYIVAKADQLRLLMSFEPLVHYDANWDISYEHGLAEGVEAVATITTSSR